jgi:hypothetical protein
MNLLVVLFSKKLQNKDNDDDEVIQILLVIIKKSRKEQGVGKKIILRMVNDYKKIILYSDVYEINFSRK